MQKDRRVVITGIGPLGSSGIGKEKFWKGILEKRTGLTLEEYIVGNEIWGKFYKHKMEDFDIREFGIEQNILNDIEKWKGGEEILDLSYLIAAVKLALDDSKLQYDREDNNIGLVLAHESPGYEHFFFRIFNDSLEIIENQLKLGSSVEKKHFFDALYQKEYKRAYDLHTFMFLFHVARVFGIHGYSLFVNNACASGLYALETASQMIRSKTNPVVVITAADYPQVYKYFWFKELDIYAKDGITKPFDKNANGFAFGDGAVGLVLEDLEYALKRKAHIYAEYLSGGFSLESWKVIFPNPRGKFYQKAINQAIERSKIKKDDIDLICAHGVSNPLIDKYEVQAIADTFGPYCKKPLIVAFKPYVGHTLGASALLESAIALLCMENNLVVPVLNSQEIYPQVKARLIKTKVGFNINSILKICSAFAGYDAAVIFRKFNK